MTSVACDIRGLSPLAFQRLVCLACLPPRQTRASQAWRTALRTRRRNRHKNQGTPSGSHPPLWATSFHVPYFITRFQREQGTGRERKERGKEGSTQTTALPSLTSQHGLEVSPLNFRLRANIHGEVGHLLGQVRGRQRLPALKGGQGAGTPLMKASQAWGWTARPHHCHLVTMSQPCWRFQTSI